MQVETSGVTIRRFKPDDETSFLQLQAAAFREFEYLPRVKSGLSALDPQGSFIAEKDGSPVGCIGIFKLERPAWFEVRNLAVKGPAYLEVAKELLARAIEQVESTHPEYLKASTPAVQPFVDLYKLAGFEPVRRSVRIVWDLSKVEAGEDKVLTRELKKEDANDAARVWVEGLRPYWNYWIEEEGGAEAVASWVKKSVPKGQGWWWGAIINDELVGLAILRPDSYGPGQARFNGAYALPEFRGRGIGSALMNCIIREAKKRDQATMRVNTLAYLDHLAPGAVLYLKTGGRIEAEYLQLEKKTNGRNRGRLHH